MSLGDGCNLPLFVSIALQMIAERMEKLRNGSNLDNMETDINKIYDIYSSAKLQPGRISMMSKKYINRQTD